VQLKVRTRTILLILLCAPTFLHGCQSEHQVPVAPPKTLADVVEEVSTSIVRVELSISYQVRAATSPESVQSETMSSWSSGTGFVIDDKGHIATAHHVVDINSIRAQLQAGIAAKGLVILPGSEAESLSVVVPVPDVNGDEHNNVFYDVAEHHPAQLLVEDNKLDISILNCNDNLLTWTSPNRYNGRPLTSKRTLPKFQTSQPHSGDAVFISGFPAVLESQNIKVQIPGLTTNSGIVSKPFFLDEFGRSVLLLDIHATHGDSGGPVFNANDGSVIGFVDRGLPTVDGGDSGLTAIVPISQILGLLQNAKR